MKKIIWLLHTAEEREINSYTDLLFLCTTCYGV